MIRPAVAADVEAIVELDRIFGADAWSAEQVTDDLRLRDVVVAERDGRVVGYAIVSVAGDVADLLRIAVDPEQRRTGTASDLLADVERRASGAGADRVIVEVAATNAGAQAFYAARGYAEIARRRAYYSDGDDALVLAHPLG